MDPGLKKTLKAVTLELRHLLEGRYDSGGKGSQAIWSSGWQRSGCAATERPRLSLSSSTWPTKIVWLARSLMPT